MRLIKDIILKYPYLLVLVLALILRIYNLGLNPVGITHDEVHDLINAKSLALTGQNTPGTVAGIFTRNAYCDGNCTFGEFASFGLIPWMRFINLDIFWSKLPFLLASLGIVFFGGKLFENISGDKRVGLITSLILVINPWSFHFGRTAFENLFAFCFYLLTLYLLTLKKFKKKYFWLALSTGLLGFLAYFGSKPLFVPIMAIGVIYQFIINKKKNFKIGIIVIILSILITLSYGWILLKSPAGERLKELTSNSSNVVATKVNEERRISLEIPKIRDLLINKYTVVIKQLTAKYLIIFNPKYLINEGETNFDTFIISNHAYLYFIDGIFIILGLIAAGAVVKNIFFILMIILVVPIPALISSTGPTTYALRSGLIFPILCGLSAWGIIWLLNNIKKLLIKKIVIILIIAIYLMSFGYFWVMYMYRMPFERSAGFVFQERALIKYLDLLDKTTEKEILIVTKDPIDLIYLYGFFTGKYNNKNYIKEINSNIYNGKYETNKIKFTRDCPNKLDLENNIYIYQKENSCIKEPNSLVRISEPRDGGARFFIESDLLCKDIKLTAYPYPRNLNEFSVEKMDRETFCKTWVNKPL